MVRDYIDKLQSELATENANEHSYRPALKHLLESLDQAVQAINEPKRSNFGNPDFVCVRKNNSNLRLGYIETKNVLTNLNEVEKSEQLQRYFGYPHLILTNYIEFRFFRNGEKYHTIEIAKREGHFLRIIPENLERLQRELVAFLEGAPEKIRSGKRLAQIMGGKARRIRDNVLIYTSDEKEASENLLGMYSVMKDLLVADLSKEKFADMYAQTLVYGLFAARYYDKTPDNFTRQEARELVPPSNPFLQHFFEHIVGVDFDRRLGYIVDELCEVFSVADIRNLILQHYNLFQEASQDPIIHFYEDFLKEYDPFVRKQMGAYYTPIPVVDFMVRAVDDVLKRDFGLVRGIADPTKVERRILLQGKKEKELYHRVQILDPAVGTATFLNQIIKHIYANNFEGQEGRWESYVQQDLLPRLHGFEIMMAPYTIAHLKLAMTLKDLGVEKFDRRLGVYLTNTLEEGVQHQDDLFGGFGFMKSITQESSAANHIKHDKPIMVVIGNPPYSVSSNNKSDFILNLIKDYKIGLNERKINLDDDYIKFIRFSQAMIEKNGEGIMALITNNSYLDGITHRKMRNSLLNTFDTVYIIDLHGSTKKREVAPDGGKDENVFNIQQGVAIILGIKSPQLKKRKPEVFHTNLYGMRTRKFDYLNKHSLTTIDWAKLSCTEPHFFFTPKNFKSKKEYDSYIPLEELFIKNSSGIESAKDAFIVKYTKEETELLFDELKHTDINTLLTRHTSLSAEKTKQVKGDIGNAVCMSTKIMYRPFDSRFTIYSPNSQGLWWRPRYEVMKNMLDDNVSLLVTKKNRQLSLNYFFATRLIADRHLLDSAADTMCQFPLYLYSETGTHEPNIHDSLMGKFAEIVEKTCPEEIFDYVYGVLHSPRYREKYKEFLKIDFPRIPLPKDRDQFRGLGQYGGELRRLHLMESSELHELITTYPIAGTHMVEKLEYQDGKIFINSQQYFDKVPEKAWNFYIGGYQPAQKWLKDRKGRTLSNEDIEHYQKIIKILLKTEEIMSRIDSVNIVQ